MSKTNKTNEKKNRIKIALGAAAVVLAGGGVIGFAVYQNYQDVYGAYCKIGNHEVSKLEYDFFYHSAINNFQNTYSAYLSMLGVDFSKDLSTQEYSDGKTWEQYFQDQAVQLMKEVYILSDAADEAGFTRTDDTYNSFYESVAKYAKQYEITQEDYLKQMYGTSATKKNLETILKTYFKAADYATYMQDNSLLPTDEEIEEYYEENKNDFDKFTYRIFTVAADPAALESNIEVTADNEKASEEATAGSTEAKEEAAATSETASSEESSTTSEEITSTSEESSEDSTQDSSGDSGSSDYTDEEWAEAMEIAKNKANEFYEQVYDEETFKELCIKYAASDDEKKTYTDSDFSLNENADLSAVPTAIQSWLSDAAREEKSTAVIEDSENKMYYVVYFVGRQRVETPTVNVRHILIMPEEVEEPADDATDEEKAEYEEKVAAADEAAKEKAEEIYQEWKDGDATEDSFAALADEYSDDSASGGLYTNVEQGQMVEGFDDWIFADGRKAGDTDIVESSYGYHIMYFEGYDGPAWKVSVISTLVQENYQKFVEDRMDNYKFEDVRGELEYLTASSELNEISEELSDDDEEESTETPESASPETADESSESADTESSESDSNSESTEDLSDDISVEVNNSTDSTAE